QLQLPAGTHVIAASSSTDSALAPAAVAATQTLTLDLALQTTSLQGFIAGNLVGTGFGAASSGSAFPNLVDYNAVAGGATIASGPLIPTPDQSVGVGSRFQINVPGGENVTITLLPPAQPSTTPCDDFAP